MTRTRTFQIFLLMLISLALSGTERCGAQGTILFANFGNDFYGAIRINGHSLDSRFTAQLEVDDELVGEPTKFIGSGLIIGGSIQIPGKNTGDVVSTRIVIAYPEVPEFDFYSVRTRAFPVVLGGEGVGVGLLDAFPGQNFDLFFDGLLTCKDPFDIDPICPQYEKVIRKVSYRLLGENRLELRWPLGTNLYSSPTMQRESVVGIGHHSAEGQEFVVSIQMGNALGDNRFFWVE